MMGLCFNFSDAFPVAGECVWNIRIYLFSKKVFYQFWWQMLILITQYSMACIPLKMAHLWYNTAEYNDNLKSSHDALSRDEFPLLTQAWIKYLFDIGSPNCVPHSLFTLTRNDDRTSAHQNTHLLRGEGQPQCVACQCPLTVKLILIECAIVWRN